MLGPPGAGKGRRLSALHEARVAAYFDGRYVARRHQAGLPLALRAKDKMDRASSSTTRQWSGSCESDCRVPTRRRVRARRIPPDALSGTGARRDHGGARRWTADRRRHCRAREELVGRLAARRICSKCGTNADSGDSVCRRCGGTLVLRSDDDERVVRERLKVYTQRSKPLVEFYRDRPTFRMVNGAQSPDRVFSGTSRPRSRRAARGGALRRGAGVASMIVCRSPIEIEKLRRVNQLVARILAELRPMVTPGVTTKEIDAWPKRSCARRAPSQRSRGTTGIRPRCACRSTSRWCTVSHRRGARRGGRAFARHGCEAGWILRRLCGDPSGRAVSLKRRTLLRVTEEALFHGIDVVRPGARVSDIGAAVQPHVEAHGFTVVREFVGHGIGTALHEEPQIANYGPSGRGPRLSEGMVLAIEPMVNAGAGGGEGAGGRLDGGDARRQPVGAFRAHRGRDPRRVRDPDAPRCGRGSGQRNCWRSVGSGPL